MKKIITNTIMKKAICATLLIMIVFQFMFPSFAWAAIEYDDGEATGTYKEWYDKILKENDEAEKELFERSFWEGFEIAKGWSYVPESGMIFNSEKGIELDRTLIEGFLEENGDKIIVRCNVDDDNSFYSVQDFWHIDDGEEGNYEIFEEKLIAYQKPILEGRLNYIEFKKYLNEEFGISDEARVKEFLVEPLKEWLNEEILVATEKEMTDAEVRSFIDHEGNDYKIIGMLSIEINRDTTVVEEVVEKVTINGLNATNMSYYLTDYNAKQGESADAGGLLLDLIFPFINFVADTLLSFLGEIMTGVDGLEQKEIEPANKESLTKEDVFEADISAVGAIDKIIGGVEGYVVSYSPEEIFSGEVELLSIDFISGKVPVRDANGNIVKDANGNITYKTNTDEGWNNIRQVIAQWYKVLRMVAIIGLLSVLIYTGIKIIISSNAKDKAKYKEWIINWFIAVAILFFMHYIMSFVISTTGQISQLITASSQEIIVEKCDEGDLQNKNVNPDNLFVTNLMGYVRFKVQTNDWKVKLGYEVMFIALVVYTFKFTFVYLKRVLNMAFLTLIAPIVALTYPIDKLNDGSAQGFQMWLKEYIFNALLQPMHLIMYYILISSSIRLAAENPLYAIVVLMFMSEAEKLLKKIFGFDKAGAGTVGGMTGAFAAGALASNVKNLARMVGKRSSGNGSSSVNDEDYLNNPKRTQDNDFSEFDDPEEEQPQQLQGVSAEQNADNQRRMVEAYDEENFGTQDYDSSEREALARDVYEPEGANYTRDEYAQFLRENGWEEDEIQNELREKYGDPQQQPDPAQNPLPQPAQQDSGLSIREMAKKRAKQIGRGVKAVGKRAIKPIWNTELPAGYNFKRLAKGAAKGLAGVTLGATAAAVQAGISITDGKYSPMEGLATFGAGFAGGSAMLNKASSGMREIANTYREGVIGGDKKELERLQMERAQARYAERDDVIAFNKKEYPSDPKAAMERQRDHYLPYGITEFKEMKRTRKYANVLQESGMSEVEADTRAAKVSNFMTQFQNRGFSKKDLWDSKKQKEFIDAMINQAPPEERAKLSGRYKNLFNAAQAFERAQN